MVGIIRACDPVVSPSGCGKTDSLQPATAGIAPTSGAGIMPSACRNRSNEHVAVTSGLANQTRAHWRAWPHDEGGNRPDYADHSAVVTPLTSTFTLPLGIIR